MLQQHVEDIGADWANKFGGIYPQHDASGRWCGSPLYIEWKSREYMSGTKYKIVCKNIRSAVTVGALCEFNKLC